MKTLLQYVALLAFGLVPLAAEAQQSVTLRDLNTYSTPIEFGNGDEIGSQPLIDVDVTFTAVVASNPRSSGLSSYNSDDNSIDRAHVFIIDTTALGSGREGMGMQIVETDVEFVEGLVRGGIYTFRGTLSPYFSTAQFDLTEQPVEVGTVTDGTYDEYASLLEPLVVSMDDININNGDGTYRVNGEKYGDLNGLYVKVEDATVIIENVGNRPNWAVDGLSRLWIYDTSLRYRNDRTDSYKTGYNYRRSEANGGKGEFVPPASGSVINLSGFLVLNNDDPGSDNASDYYTFSINPFEDGTYWSPDGQRFDDGQDVGGVPFEWPNDIELVASPPSISNVALSPVKDIYATSDAITVTLDAVSSESTIDSVVITYSVGGTSTSAVMSNSSGDTYTFEFPSVTDVTVVSYYAQAYSSDGLTARYPVTGSESFLVSDSGLSSVQTIQETADGKSGASPLAGLTLPMDIKGTVVRVLETGKYIFHDEDIANGTAAEWLGVVIEDDVTLEEGQVITITSAKVNEDENFGESQTYLSDVAFSVVETVGESAIEEAIPSVYTEDMLASLGDAGREMEAYEGLYVRLEDAYFLEENSFGEFTVANMKAGETEVPASGVKFDDNYGFPNDVNQHIREGAVFTSIMGHVTSTFNEVKIQPKSLDDVKGESWSFPVLEFALLTPPNDVEVEVTSDINISWDTTVDYDGDSLSYNWVLYGTDYSVLTSIASADGESTLPFADADALLASLELEVGQSVEALWNVTVTDSEGTFPVASDYDFGTSSYDTLYHNITLTRGVATSTESNGELPASFALEQNYPNPFNPTTTVAFDVPQAANVRIEVYNILGQSVSTLLNETRAAGSYTLEFDASNLATGTYILRMESLDFVQTRRMMLIK